MSEEPQYSLVMPFVVCASEGGPYEDEAFVAGWDLGRLDARLGAGSVLCETFVRPASMPQVDLLAMKHGYVCTSVPWEEDPEEWTFVKLVKQGP